MKNEIIIFETRCKIRRQYARWNSMAYTSSNGWIVWER